MSEPIEYATYSVEDDKLRLYSGRVSRELFDRLRELGFQRAYQQECFYAVWSPSREDLVLELAGEITDEDTTLEERAEARASRFNRYSVRAERRAEAASDAAHEAVRGIEPGQPILVGHHSEARHRRDLDRSWNAMGQAVQASERSEYWADRAQGVFRNAAHKYAPTTVYNRIKKLKAEIRKYERERKYPIDDIGWARSRYIYDTMGKPYGTQYDDLTPDERAQVDADIERAITNAVKCADRWIGHLTEELAYWETIYAQIGGVAADKSPDELKVGDWIIPRWQTGGRWAQVKRVSKGRDGTISSVTINPKEADPSDWCKKRVVPYQEIKEHKTAEEYQA